MSLSARTARVARLLAGALTLAGLCAPPALAQDAAVPTHSAVAGEPFSAAGASAELVDGTCSNLRDVSINWRDGTPRTPVSGSLAAESIPNPSPPYEPFPAFRVTVPTTKHVFPDVPQPVVVDVRVSYRVTCVNLHERDDPSDDEPYDFHGNDQRLFNVLIRPATPAPPTSCPSPFAGITAHGRSVALAAQQACEEPKKRFNRQQKLVLRSTSKVCFAAAPLDALFAYLLLADPDPLASKVAAPFVAGRAVGWVYCGGVLAALSDDPPDPKYRSVAQPSRVRVPRVVGEGARAVAINRYLRGLARSASLYKALLTAIERAQGATVAKRKKFEKRQMLAAASYASRLADVLEDLVSDSRAATRALASVVGKPTVTEAQMARAKEGLAATGLPDSIDHPLRRLGRLGEFTREALLARIAETPATDLAAQVPHIANDSAATRRAFRRVARTMRTFAKQARRRPLRSH